MSKRDIKGIRTIVTGASSGIGRAIAHELARRGGHTVLVARRQDNLESLAAEISADETATGKTEIVVGDVTDAMVRKAAIERSVAAYGALDALVNNAGIGAIGPFQESTPERLRQIMEVNFFAAAEMTREALGALQAGRSPIVVNIGSILGHRGLCQMSEYCSSKFALQGLSQSLRVELKKIGIDLLMVSPGTTRSEFFDSVVHGRGETPFPKGRGTTAATVARKTVEAMRKGKREIIPSFSGWWLVWANKNAPGIVDYFMGRYA